MHRLLLFCMLLSVPLAGSAQDSPYWHRHKPLPTAHVDFVSGTGNGSTEAVARLSAYLSALVQVSTQDSVSATSRLQEHIEEVIRRHGPVLEGESVDRVTAEIAARHGQITLVPGLREVTSQYQRTSSGEHRAWILFAIPRSGASKEKVIHELERLQEKRRRSVQLHSLVPGAAQFYKGDPWRGGFFIASEAILVGTSVLGLFQEQRLASEIAGSRSPRVIQALQEKRAAWQRVTLVSAVATGAVYLISLIDGLHTDSDRHPLLSMSLQPRMGRDRMGVRLALRF